MVNKFELEEPSLKSKTFSAALLNKINVLDFDNINNYKTVKSETKQRQASKEVESKLWYKRLFGIKDTVTYMKEYQEKKEVIDGGKFYNEIINPIGKSFRKIVKDSEVEFSNTFREYNDSFKDLVIHSFDETINSVFQQSETSLSLTNEEKNNRLRKFYKITKAISILKTPESNEELYRKSALTY